MGGILIVFMGLFLFLAIGGFVVVLGLCVLGSALQILTKSRI